MPCHIGVKKGDKYYMGAIFHDDGVNHYGGESLAIFGAMGSGKSTLLQYLAQYTRYLPEGSKDAMIARVLAGHPADKTEPETIVYRGRQFDIWNSLLPDQWMKSQPDFVFEPKPVYLFVHKDDPLQFTYIDNKTNKRHPLPDLPQVSRYVDAEDLFGRIRHGAINIVYEPERYQLSRYLARKLSEKKMERQRVQSEKPQGKLRRLESETKKIRDTIVPSPIFWYDFIYQTAHLKGNEFMTFIVDEFHDVAEGRSEGDMWKLADIFANRFVDIRKLNISFYLVAHDTVFVDWRIFQRIERYCWLPRCRIPPDKSPIYPAMVKHLSVGEAYFEHKLSGWGFVEFPRIKNQPPLVRVIGGREKDI